MHSFRAYSEPAVDCGSSLCLVVVGPHDGRKALDIAELHASCHNVVQMVLRNGLLISWATFSAAVRFILLISTVRLYHYEKRISMYLHDFVLYVCMYGHTYSKSMDQPGEVANPARGQLNRGN